MMSHSVKYSNGLIYPEDFIRLVQCSWTFCFVLLGTFGYANIFCKYAYRIAFALLLYMFCVLNILGLYVIQI